MHKQSRLEKLEQAAEAKRAQVHPVTPDCGPVDWPTTPEGWAILVNHAVTLTAGRPEVLERLRVAYGEGL